MRYVIAKSSGEGSRGGKVIGHTSAISRNKAIKEHVEKHGLMKKV